MTYQDQLAEVLNHEVGEVVASPILIMSLLRLYSALYLQGRPPGTCGNCHREYYNKLKRNGMEKAKQADEVAKRTCEPKWKGLKFIAKLAKHFNDTLITDAQAISLLDAGFLKPEDFKVLPDRGEEKPVVKVVAKKATHKGKKK